MILNLIKLIAFLSIAVVTGCVISTTSRVESSRNSIVRILAINSVGQAITLGTGFIVQDALAATAKHVLDAVPVGYDIYVAPSNATILNRENRVCTVYADPTADLALLYSEEIRNIKPLPLSSGRDIKDGEQTLVMGFPSGDPGLVSSQAMIASQLNFQYKQTLPSVTVLRLDGNISPGNSGGPVIRISDGKVIGVVTQKRILPSPLLDFKDGSEKSLLKIESPLADALKKTLIEHGKQAQLGIGYATSISNLEEEILKQHELSPLHPSCSLNYNSSRLGS